MQLYANQLEGQLKRGLAPLYLIHGDEPLLIEECRDAIRDAARRAGYGEREVYTVEAGFDWNRLFNASRSLALFAGKCVLDLRVPTGKPGEAGAKMLIDMAANPPPDTLLVVSCGKLERGAREARWVKALDKAGVTVAVYPVEAAQLPGWVARRLQARGLKAGAGVVELLAHHFEGNLLACAQEIDRLALVHPQGTLSIEAIEADIADQARFTVFGLADSCLEGTAAAVPRVLRRLRAEGVEATLVLWALAREVRVVAALAAEVAGGRPLAQALDAHQVWTKRKPLLSRALARGRPQDWEDWLTRAAEAERVIKGRRAGDPWRALECLALEMAGLRLPTCR